MHFEKHGRTYQLRIRDAGELEQVLDLDDSLWIAMSAPISGLNGNREFLDYVDLDDNGRIRVDEMRSAIRWLLKRLADRSRLAEQSDLVPLDAIDASGPEGQALRGTAEYVLDYIGADQTAAVGLVQVYEFESSINRNAINGDGVVPPAATDDEGVAQFIRDVMACVGEQEDLTGEAGITEAELDRFLKEAEGHLAWAAEAEIPPGRDATEIMALGERTGAAFRACKAVRDKVDAFFARCRAVRFNPRAAEVLGVAAAIPPAEAAQAADAQSLDAALARAPLAKPDPDGVLPLDDASLNPLYAGAMAEFRRLTVEPILGQLDQLSEAQWGQVRRTLAAYENWLTRKKGADVEALGHQKLQLCLDGPFAEAVRVLFEADREVARRLAAARELKKLLLYHKYLLPLANNFVSFPHLYDPTSRAMFEMGSLVIDGRWFNFAVRVEDLQEHTKVARTSGMYVMYVELTRAGQTEKLTVAAPATSGTVGNLCVGKRGIFHDTAGRHYDARVVNIIENPISFREALVAPFVRLGRFIGGKIEAISGSAQKELEAQVGRVTDQVQTGVQQTVREAPQMVEQAAASPQQAAASTSAARRDLLLGVSVSIAALSSAFAFITERLSSAMKQPLQLVLALVVVLLVVFVPTALVAFFKLRRRDLSAILEGCGWATNARMRLNRRQRTQFTHLRGYPAGATGTPRSRWLLAVLMIVLLSVAGVLGYRELRSWVKARGAVQEQGATVEGGALPAAAESPGEPPQESPQ